MRITHFALAGISLAALAACDSPSAPPPPAGGESAATGAAGNVAGPALRIVGSSTVYPFTTAVAENFKRKFPAAATPIVESTGTGGGIKLFCGGVGTQHPDIANASRRIKASEVEMCNTNGVKQIVEVQVGLDGIALAQAKAADDMDLTPRADLPRARRDQARRLEEHRHDLEPDRRQAPQSQDRGARPAADVGHARRLQRTRHGGRLRARSRT